MDGLTRAQFPRAVMDVVRARFPLVRLESTDEAFAIRINDYLASLENLFRIVQQHPDALKHHVERWVVELLRAGEGHPDDRQGFDAVRERVYPMLLPEEGMDSSYANAVSQPLVTGLRVAYAIDSDRSLSYIPRGLFETWEIDLDTLHEAALSNLVRKSEELPAHAAQDEEGNVNLVLIQTLDGYDASRILLPTLNERLRGHLGTPFVAGVPNRDILVCFRDDPELQARMRTQIAEDFKTMPHQLTDQLFLVTPDGIAPFGAAD